MTSPRARWTRRLLVATLVAGALVAGVPQLRRPLLRGAGRALVAEDALGKVDIIVLASESRGAGPLEVADLVRQGVSARAAVLAFTEDPALPAEYRRRGVSYEGGAERSVRLLAALGVEAVVVIPTPVSGSEDQGRVLPPWCEQNGFRSILVVTEADHSRRVRRILRRSFRGRDTTVAVRVPRYSQFDPDAWWESRAGTRTALVEIQKLLFDLLRHPFS